MGPAYNALRNSGTAACLEFSLAVFKYYLQLKFLLHKNCICLALVDLSTDWIIDFRLLGRESDLGRFRSMSFLYLSTNIRDCIAISDICGSYCVKVQVLFELVNEYKVSMQRTIVFKPFTKLGL